MSSLLLQHSRSIRLRHKKQNDKLHQLNSKRGRYLYTTPNKNDVKRPSPRDVVVYESPDDGTDCWTEEGSYCIQHHWPIDLFFDPHVCDGAACHRKKCGAGEPA